VGEDLILDDRRVVLDVDLLKRHRRDLGDHDAPEGVGDGRVDADEVELALGRGDAVNLDLEVLRRGCVSASGCKRRTPHGRLPALLQGEGRVRDGGGEGRGWTALSLPPWSHTRGTLAALD
jgi:hypothetical protein